MGRNKGKFSPTQNWPSTRDKKKSSARERMDFARELWLRDPKIPINGNGGMVSRLFEKFGVGARSEQLVGLRAEAIRKSKVFNPAMREGLEQVSAVPDESPAKPAAVAPAPAAVPSAVIPSKPRRTGPGTTKSRGDAVIRASFAREFLRKNPAAKQLHVRDALVEEFGMGIDNRTIGDLQRDLGLTGADRRRAQYDRIDRTTPKEETMSPSEEFSIVERKTAPACPEDAVRAALELLMSEVPNLRSLSLSIDDEGKRDVEFEVAALVAGKVSL